MADLINSTWSETDSSNTQPAPSGFPSGILPSQVGGVVRAMMGATKRAFDHSNAIAVSTGSANAYVLTYEQPLQSGYVKGEVFRFFSHFTNTGAATLNINGAGTRSLVRADGTALSPNEIVAGQVVTVICDGTNFLHQSVGSRFFKDDVSISKASDSVLSLEDTSAPTTTFRQKKIYSSKNVNGGNDWLFRQVRPSDGATEDFTFKSGAAGTVWTTGNFNPALKADLAGSTFSGDITTYRSATPTTGVLYLGNQSTNGGRYLYYDGTNYNLPGAQTIVASLSSQGNAQVGGQLYARAGRLHVADNNAAGYVHFGNADQAVFGHDSANFVANGPGTLFINNTEVTRQNQYHAASGYGFAAHNTYLYADAGQENLVIRTGPPSAFKYTTVDPNGFLTSAAGMRANGDLISTGRVVVGEGQPASYIEMRDTDQGTRFLHNNSGYIGFLGSDGGWKARVGDDGAFWTAQLGDLNTRIETRAADFANDRASYRVAKTGDVMTGNLSIQPSSYPSINFLYPNVKWWGWQVRENGWFYAGEDNLANFNFALVPGGNIWSNAFGGYLTDYVTNKANAAANARGDRVAKTGDTMTGNLALNYANPLIQFYYGGVMDGRLWMGNDAVLRWSNVGNDILRVGPGGTIWTAQFGDLNNRIEDRAYAWAATRQAALGYTPVEQSGGPYQQGNKIRIGWDGSALRLSVDGGDQERIVHRSWLNPLNDIRLAYAGDLDNSWNLNGREGQGAYLEPYGGAVMTTRYTNQPTPGATYWSGARWRYLQKQDSYGNWYTVGYA